MDIRKATTKYEATYVRDSLHYLIPYEGSPFFSSEDTGVLRNFCGLNNEDTLFCYTTQMTPGFVATTVPAGSFYTKELRTTYKLYPASYNPVLYTRRAVNVGVVEETRYFYVGHPSILYGRRLLRWKH